MSVLRTDVPQKDCWDLTPLYSSLEAWTAAFEAPFERVSYQGNLADLTLLRQALSQYFSEARLAERLYTWAHLKHDEDIALSSYKVAYEKALNRLQQLAQDYSWLEPEILALSEAITTAPELAAYRFYLEKLFRLKAHRLSSREEELLALAMQPLTTAHKSFSSLTNADFHFNSVTDESGKSHALSHAYYSLHLQSKDRTLRKNTFFTYHEKYHEYKNTFCDLLQGQITAHLFEAKARHFSSCLEAALKPKNIPLAVYHTLIKTIKNNLQPFTDYCAYRKKKLGNLHLYDMNVVMAHDFKIPYADAEQLVIASVHPLGTEYQTILRQGLQSGWVDRFENKGKRSGAYSSGCFDSHPYILMNYKEILRDVFTLAHEAGHSLHSYYSRKHQPYHYSDYPIFVAEVASTFNEQLLFTMMLKKASSAQEKEALLQSQIDNIRATLFRQTMFAEFELFVHTAVEEGRPLTPDILEEAYLNLVKSYFPSSVTIDDIIAIEWARIPHFYYNFYVYQYATGISAALALSQQVLQTSDPAAYLRFLQGGCSRYPIDLLKEAGVDMTTEAPFMAALAYFHSLTKELASLSSNWQS